MQKLEIADSDLAQYAARSTTKQCVLSDFFDNYKVRPATNGYGNVSWSAAIASLYNYQNGYMKNTANALSANDVYDMAVGIYNTPMVGGTVNQVQELLAIYNLNSTYKDGSLTLDQVYENLSVRNKPVMIRMYSGGAAKYPSIDGVIYGCVHVENGDEVDDLYKIYDGQSGYSFNATVKIVDGWEEFSGGGSEPYSEWSGTFSFF